MKNLYAILNVSPKALPDEVQRSYRRLARDLHPDVTKNDPEKTEKFKEVCAAYAILKDPEQRRQYDEELALPRAPGLGREGRASTFGPMFDELVNRVETEGIWGGNLDSLLSEFLKVAQDVQKRAPAQVKKTVEDAKKSPGGLLDLIEDVFDAKISWDKQRGQKK